MAAEPPPTPDRDSSDPAALQRWYEYGKCLVEREGRKAEKILAAPPESVEYVIAFLQADGPAFCFKNQSGKPFKLHSNAMRGAVVEALLIRDFSAVGVLRSKAAAKVFDEATPIPIESNGEPVRARTFLKLAECVVSLEPVKSFAVFSTPVASSEERKAIGALVPTISDCLPPNLQLQIHTPMLRSYLAEAAYRLSVRSLSGTR